MQCDPGLRDQWFGYRDDALAEYACAWLAAKGIEAEVVRRRT